MTAKSRLTVAEFDELVGLPENTDKRLEFIGGEVFEVVSNNYASMVAAHILGEIGAFIKGKNLGRLTGADGGYIVSGERYIPDVAFISRARQPEPSHETYNALAPNLAVEVLSPSDEKGIVTDKVVGYLAAGTVVWVIDPDKQQAKIYEPGQPVKTIPLDGVLDGGNVLPGFALPLKDIFADQ
jgi:Uma2 family endonuclease